MVFVNADRLTAAEEQERSPVATFRDVGRILSLARKEKNLTIKEVANKIYVRRQYLIALEAGNLDDLPGRVYILGFIRNYARFLSLDGEELVRQVNALPSVPDYERRQVSTISPPPEEGPNIRTLVVSAILVVLFGLGGYTFFRSQPDVDVSRETVPSQESTEDLIQAPMPSAPLDQETVEPEESKENTLEKPETGKTLAIEDHASLSIPKDQPVAQNPKIDLKPVPQTIVVKAKKPAWIEIRDPAGTILLMKVLQAGQQYIVPEKPGLILNTGNAGGIDIFVGETKLPPLGAYGQVKRNIRLESLR
jgi:cytoskeleton protein RodZ